MVSTRGKSKIASPSKTSESNEVAENAEAESQASQSLTGSATGKKKTDSPNITSEANEVAENEEAEGQALQSLTVNMEEVNGDGQFDDKVEIPVEETGAEGSEEMPGEEESVQAKVETDDWNLKVGSDNKVELEQISSEDDELDDQEDQMWEDDEESSEEEEEEENIADEDGVSDEDSIKEDDEVDEVSAEEDGDAEIEVSAEEEDDGKDEVSRDKITEVAKGDENKAKEDGGEAQPKEDGEEAKAKEDGQEAKAKEDEKEAKEHDSGKIEEGLKNDKNSNKKVRKKKVRVAPKKVDSKDKPESSQSKGKKKVESMGMIFMCSSKTRSDCFHYKVLGLPESKKDIVEKIYSGMRLFLYDVDLKLLHGIFKAAGPGGYNLEPKAFQSKFPSQVRYVVLDDCLPLPEEKFKKVIKKNYYSKNKFDCQLKAEQVKQLCKLFVISSKGHLPKKVPGPRKGQKAENPNSVGPVTSRRRRVGDKRHPAPEEEELRFREHPRKRTRKVITSPRRRPLPAQKVITSPRRQPLPARKVITSPRRQPLPAPVSSFSYERTSNVDAYYGRDQYSYRDRLDMSPVTRRDPYRDGLDPSHVIRRDPYLERAYPYRDGRDLYVDRRDPYRDARDTYARRHPDPYIDVPASYLERRDPDIGIHSSSYRDGRASYLERRDPYRDPAYSVPYSSAYRRDPPLLDARDAYREDQGGEYRSSLRREEVLERGGLHPLTVETRYRPDIGSRDPYVAPTRQLPSFADPIYSAEYPSRTGLARNYRL